MRNLGAWCLLGVFALLLSACSDDSNSTPAPATTDVDSATDAADQPETLTNEEAGIDSAPDTDQPIDSAPDTDQPIDSAPDTDQPVDSALDTDQPIDSAPDTDQPIDSALDTQAVDVEELPKCPIEVNLYDQVPCDCYGTLVYDVFEAMPDCDRDVLCCPSEQGLKCE